VDSLVKLTDGQAVTTTPAIALGTGNEHKAVIQLVRTYRDDLEEFGRVAFEMAPFATTGGTQSREIALLNEPQATLILTYMRNNDVVRQFKKALVRAFYELARPIDLSDPAALRGLLLTYSERVETLEKTVTAQAPKVQAFERLKSADGLMCLRDAAKALGVSEQKVLIPWLLLHHWCYRRPGTNRLIGYQDKSSMLGYLDHKCVTVPTDDGEKEVVQVKVTPKGMARLAQIFAHRELEGRAA